ARGRRRRGRRGGRRQRRGARGRRLSSRAAERRHEHHRDRERRPRRHRGNTQTGPWSVGDPRAGLWKENYGFWPASFALMRVLVLSSQLMAFWTPAFSSAGALASAFA